MIRIGSLPKHRRNAPVAITWASPEQQAYVPQHRAEAS
jgi:hypothetical protein